MAESITEGTLAAFNKEVGDFVSQDETIATIETDKIDVEVNAPVSGTITEFLVDVDATVEVGQEIIKMEEGDAPAGVHLHLKLQLRKKKPLKRLKKNLLQLPHQEGRNQERGTKEGIKTSSKERRI